MPTERLKIPSLLDWLDRNSSRLVLAFVLLFLLSGVLTLHDYGMTWDEGLGNFFFGERYLNYFTTFQETFLDFKADLNALRHQPLHLYQSPFHNIPNEFPPVADTLSAATMYLFSYGLGWLNPIDGFHLATVLLASAFLFSLYRFSAPRLGKLSAWIAILLLASFPRFWADMHFNVKDIPETIFFGWTLMAFWSWYEKPAWGKAILTGLLFGAALGVKANALFILPILGLAILPKSLRREEWAGFVLHLRHQFGQYLGIAATAIAFYFVSWPNLYAHPINNLLAYWKYILSQGGRDGGPNWNLEPLRQAITTTPEWMLILLGLGLVWMVLAGWRKNSALWSLLLLWFAIPILRICMPRAVNFDGIRHFIEFVPAAALIAGYGASRSVHWLARGVPARSLAFGTGTVLILAANLAWIYPGQYPYLHIYYNSLTGGLVGAQKAGLTGAVVDYWGSSYRQGMEWVRQNAPQSARVHAMSANWLLELSAPVLLRPDIQVLADPLPDFHTLEAANAPTYLFFLYNPASQQDELAYSQAHYPLVFEIKCSSIILLQIYRAGK
jgi:hypothetical protein